MSLALFIWLGATALAGGFYSPSDTAGQSSLYQESATVASAKAEALEQASQSLAAALNQYEEGLDLLGLESTDRAHFKDVRKKYNRQFAVATAFVHTLLEDFDTEFSGALQRALSQHRDALVCAATRPVGGRALPGIRTRFEANPACTGDNLNAALANAMDDDPTLQDAVREMLALPWPVVDRPSTPQPVVGNGGLWISARLFHELPGLTFPGPLQLILEEDEAAREALFANGLEALTTDDKKGSLARAQAITTATTGKRHQFAQPVLAAVLLINAKRIKKGQIAYTWCPTPRLLGGCVGDDISPDALQALLEDKRLQKALP